MPNPTLEQNTIRVTYRIVTPMFCGGAEQWPEFRLASFRVGPTPRSDQTAWSRISAAPTGE